MIFFVMSRPAAAEASCARCCVLSLLFVSISATSARLACTRRGVRKSEETLPSRKATDSVS